MSKTLPREDIRNVSAKSSPVLPPFAHEPGSTPHLQSNVSKTEPVSNRNSRVDATRVRAVRQGTVSVLARCNQVVRHAAGF